VGIKINGFYFLDIVEGELAVAGIVVNLFKDRGVDLWLVWQAGGDTPALRGQQAARQCLEERRAVTNTALASELEDHQLISVNSDIASTVI
jgi:predicted phage-related endonuclease